jgi:hypothetical protein
LLKNDKITKEEKDEYNPHYVDIPYEGNERYDNTLDATGFIAVKQG